MRYIIPDKWKSAYHENSKPWYLLGITSFGTKRCGSAYPKIYTRYILVYFQPLMDFSHHHQSFRVESFIPWIQETI